MEEGVNVGRVDPASCAELVAGQLSPPDPVADRAVGDSEVGSEAALGEERWGSGFSGHTFGVRFRASLHRVTCRNRPKSNEGQSPAAPSYWRPSHGEAVPRSAARRGGRSNAAALPCLADVLDQQGAAQARHQGVRSVSAVGVGACGEVSRELPAPLTAAVAISSRSPLCGVPRCGRLGVVVSMTDLGSCLIWTSWPVEVALDSS